MFLVYILASAVISADTECEGEPPVQCIIQPSWARYVADQCIMNRCQNMIPPSPTCPQQCIDQGWENYRLALAQGPVDANVVDRKPDDCPWYCGTACIHPNGGPGLICELWCNGNTIFEVGCENYDKTCWARVRTTSCPWHHAPVGTQDASMTKEEFQTLMQEPIQNEADLAAENHQLLEENAKLLKQIEAHVGVKETGKQTSAFTVVDAMRSQRVWWDVKYGLALFGFVVVVFNLFKCMRREEKYNVLDLTQEEA